MHTQQASMNESLHERMTYCTTRLRQTLKINENYVPISYFSADLYNAYGNWSFAPPASGGDAVVINLGTNDRPAPPALEWQAAYVSFVHSVISLRANPALQVFIAYGPMTSEYEPFVLNITSTLVAQVWLRNGQCFL
jgi:hypothetical protein